MVGDDDVADPADGDAQRQPRRRQVEETDEVEVPAAGRPPGDEDAASEAAEEADPTLPDLQPVERGGIAVDVVEDVHEPGADDGADRGSGQHRGDHLVVDASSAGVTEEEPGADEEAHGGEDAVG